MRGGGLGGSGGIPVHQDAVLAGSGVVRIDGVLAHGEIDKILQRVDAGTVSVAAGALHSDLLAEAGRGSALGVEDSDYGDEIAGIGGAAGEGAGVAGGTGVEAARIRVIADQVTGV